MMNHTVYLVVEPMEIIARDLAMNVQDFDTDATVLIAGSPEAALKSLQDIPSVRLAFVHIDPRIFSKTDLAQRLVHLGAQVVFIGNAAEQDSGDGLVLHRPFSAETTAKLLRRTVSVQDV